MIQLQPREQFTVVRQIEDHTDSTTYYVQAVIRNARTDALIATINLDDNGDRRFSKAWLVPADVSGRGFWISILTSVYTDSGYTTKSSNYGDKMDTYLIQDRYVFNPNYPLPTGQDIDYKRIEKIVSNVKPQDPKVITVVKEVVVKTPMEMPKMPDMSPVILACKDMVSACKELAKQVQSVSQSVSENMTKMNEHNEMMIEDKKESKADNVKNLEKISSAIDTVSKKLDKLSFTLPDMEIKFAKSVANVGTIVSPNDRIKKLMKKI
jgi:hypothetical protein